MRNLEIKPLKNRDMRIVICWMMRALFLCGGFHHLKVKGRKAETKDAPVLALAPHSSFFDALPVVYLGGPSIVAKGESSRLPFFGSRSQSGKPDKGEVAASFRTVLK